MSYGVNIGQYPLCSRCLVNLDARSYFKATMPNVGKQVFCQHPTDPAAVRRWAEAALEEDGETTFDMDAWSRALTPVTTWGGDPICIIHLIECRQREQGR